MLTAPAAQRKFRLSEEEVCSSQTKPCPHPWPSGCVPSATAEGYYVVLWVYYCMVLWVYYYVPMGLYRIMCTFMGLYGFVWYFMCSFMGLYGFITGVANEVCLAGARVQLVLPHEDLP
jgi:hypothetical protein